MNALTIVNAVLALAERAAPIVLEAIERGLSKDEIRARLHAAADEFLEAVVGARDRIEADDQGVLAALDAFRRGQ